MSRNSLVKEKYRSQTVHLVSQSHIDMVWMWDWQETLKVFQNTFGSMLEAMAKHPGFTYSQNSAAAYQAVEKHFPILFKQIQQAVQKGRWEISGGAWVESYEAMASGESLVRQYFYGKKYFKEKFNFEVKTAFNAEGAALLPCLPQVLKKSGIDHIVAGRQTIFSPVWQPLCRWKGNDGSEVVTACLRHYWHPFHIDSCDPYTPQTLDMVRAYASEYENKFGLHQVLYLFGQGDHGGNPHPQDLINLTGLIKAKATPRMLFSSMAGYFKAALKDKPVLPVITDMAGRSAPAASHSLSSSWARYKRTNALAEAKLMLAEFMEVLIRLQNKESTQETVDAIWKDLLFNQFHDVAWGSCLDEIQRDTDQAYRDLFQKLDGHLENTANKLHPAPGKAQNPEGCTIYNVLPWKRSTLVECVLPKDYSGFALTAKDNQGNVCPVQWTPLENNGCVAHMLASQLPASSQSTLRFEWSRAKKPKSKHSSVSPVIRNKHFTLKTRAKSGCLDEILITNTGKPLFSGPGPAVRLDLFEDHGNPWNMDLTTLQNERCRLRVDKRKGILELQDFEADFTLNRFYTKDILQDRIQRTEKEYFGDAGSSRAKYFAPLWTSEEGNGRFKMLQSGPLFSTYEILNQYNKTRISQQFTVYEHFHHIDLAISVDWHETEKALFVSFPLEGAHAGVLAGMPYHFEPLPDTGAFRHLQRWLLLKDHKDRCLVSNDGAAVCRWDGKRVSVFIIRAPLMVRWKKYERTSRKRAEYSDQGLHMLRFRLQPLSAAQANPAVASMEALNFTVPVLGQAHSLIPATASQNLSLVRFSGTPVILSALKPAYDKKGVILRFYEAEGKKGKGRVALSFGTSRVWRTNMLEEKEQAMLCKNNGFEFDIKPFEVMTYYIQA